MLHLLHIMVCDSFLDRPF